MLTRAFTGSIFVTIILYASFRPPLYFMLFLFFESIIIFEAARMLNIKGLKLFLLSSLLLVFTLLAFSTVFFLNGVLALTMLSNLVLIVHLFTQKITPIFVKTVTFASILGGCLSLLLLPFDDQSHYNPWTVIFVFSLVWASDTFAYLFGMMLGRTKLLERVSPKKTVEGLIGGALATGLIAFFVASYFKLPQNIWLSMGLIIPFYGTLGDLVVSQFKRRVGVKDTGSILPGHGGLYDRLDSMLFVVPLVYAILFYDTHNLLDWSMKVTQPFVYLLNHL